MQENPQNFSCVTQSRFVARREALGTPFLWARGKKSILSMCKYIVPQKEEMSPKHIHFPFLTSFVSSEEGDTW